MYIIKEHSMHSACNSHMFRCPAAQLTLLCIVLAFACNRTTLQHGSSMQAMLNKFTAWQPQMGACPTGEEVCGSGSRHGEDNSAGEARSPGLLQDQGTALQRQVCESLMSAAYCAERSCGMVSSQETSQSSLWGKGNNQAGLLLAA